MNIRPPIIVLAAPLACCNLSFADLLQLAKTACSKPVDNKEPVDNKFWQLTCSKSVDNTQQACCQHAVATHASESWYHALV